MVEQLLSRLAPLDREVLYLFAVAGFKTDEIGAILGVRGAAVRQRLYRARERVRELWADAA
jgi:RNA polymerase sigma factor (sigma-70 family)